MILRILGEGQFEVPEPALAQLQELDNALADAVEGSDEARFRTALAELLDYVRQNGSPLPEEGLDTSDAILPGEDAAVAEVRALLLDDGIVPGE